MLVPPPADATLEDEKEDDPELADEGTNKSVNPPKKKAQKKKGKKPPKKFAEAVPCGIGKCKVSIIQNNIHMHSLVKH